MARKRLNKKVALIGSLFFVFVLLAAIGLILYLSQDPEKFIKDGDNALLAQDYETAQQRYLKARARSKSDSLTVEILFKLIDVFLKTDKWDNVQGCWSNIIKLDRRNIMARYGRLKYTYIVANNGARGYWKEVASQTEEFIEVVEEQGLLADDTAKWESFGIEQTASEGQKLGSYLYLLKGKALLRMAVMGAVLDPDEVLAQAVSSLEKVKELEPNNVEASWYLAQAAVAKGNILASEGHREEAVKGLEKAEEILERSIAVAEDSVEAHINLLRVRINLVQSGGSGLTEEQVRGFEREYLSLVEKFTSDARAYAALGGYYGDLGPKSSDKLTEAFEKAMELDKENVMYAINAAGAYYQKYSLFGANSAVDRVVAISKNALELPNSEDRPGPRYWANRNNRSILYRFQAQSYIAQVLEANRLGLAGQPHTQELLKKAEQAVHHIEQVIGSGEDPRVIKWRGMLELARGNKADATRKLYTLYEQLKASGKSDAQLSYTLAELFKETVELGAARDYYMSALSISDRSNPDRIDNMKPEALLDCADILLRLRTHGGVLNLVNFFEKEYWSNERSQMLRVKAYIAALQLDQAEKELAEINTDDINKIKLNIQLLFARIKQAQAEGRVKDGDGKKTLIQAELSEYTTALDKMLTKLLSLEPDSVEFPVIRGVCDNYVREGKVGDARRLIGRVFGYFPDNVSVLAYKTMLNEPNPVEISGQRRKEIEYAILSDIADPLSRAVNVSRFYKRNGQLDEAEAELKKVVNFDAASEETVEEDEKTKQLRTTAFGSLFDIALEKKDFELAEQLVDVARSKDIDGCEGNFFAGRLAFAQEDYQQALVRFDQCLKKRPVFSYCLMLRSRVNKALGNDNACVVDAQKAAALNPLDGTIATMLGFALYERNQKLGNNITSDQIIEAKQALIRAVAINPGNLRLLNFYAEYISQSDSSKALAIRQRLLEEYPTLENALMLGNMAMRIARNEAAKEKKQALFDIAASSFEKAMKLDPQSKALLNSYSEYYRLIGQEEKAKELLAQSGDRDLLYAHYLRAGRFEDARRTAEELYAQNPEDAVALKALIIVSEKTADKESVKKFSRELVAVEDTIENRLLQIQIFLNIGLVKEAGLKLESFKEKYPEEPRALLLESFLTMKKGQLKKALQLINQNLASDQDNATAWRLRGEINRLTEHFEQAITDLKQSKSLADDLVTRLSLVKAYIGAGRNEDAIMELNTTIDQPGAPMEARELLENIYWRLNKRSELKRFYEKTLEKFPDNQYWHNRAAEFSKVIGDLEGAERLYAMAWGMGTRDSWDDVIALDGYLGALLLQDKYDEVLEQARKYTDGEFASLAFLKMAEVKLKLNDRETALKYCKTAVEKAGTNESVAFNSLKKMLSLLGLEEVTKYCRERLDTNPDSLSVNFIMSHLMRMNGEYNKALEYIDRCLEIGATDGDVEFSYMKQKVEILQLAYIKTSDNDYLYRAVTEYESLLEKMPNNIVVMNNMAYMLADNDMRLDEALEYAERVYDARPNNAGFLDTYAYVLYKNGKFKQADEFMQAALQQYELDKVPLNAEVHEHIGMIKEKIGSRRQALSAYEQALELGGENLSKVVISRIKAAIERLSR